MEELFPTRFVTRFFLEGRGANVCALAVTTLIISHYLIIEICLSHSEKPVQIGIVIVRSMSVQFFNKPDLAMLTVTKLEKTAAILLVTL